MTNLGPKSSSAQLWAEVQRLRNVPNANDGAPPIGPGEDARARERESTLLKELRAARASGSVQGVAGERVAGKPAVADFRHAWDRFTAAVNRLPAVREAEGMHGVRLAVAQDLVADLYLLSLAPPRGRIEARERDRLRRMLDTESTLALLTRREQWSDRIRSLFLGQCARVYFRPSVWRAYVETSADLPSTDRWGTVLK